MTVTTTPRRPTPLPLRADLIPLSLRHLVQFVCWNYEWIDASTEKPGRWTKEPYLATSTTQHASSADPRTWRTFDQATVAVEAAVFDGLGIMMANRLTAIDLDHCVDEGGVIADWAQRIIDSIDSYTELSPSGEGIRILAWTDGLPEGRRKRGNVEMYDSGRYVTLTGHHLAGTSTDVEERTEEIGAVHAEVFAEAAAHRAPANDAVNGLSDEEVLRLARGASNGAKFISLWNGNVPKGASHSEADLALCSLAAFWTRRNTEQMDRLFRRSKLMRPKWDERHGNRTYGQLTIAKAVEQTREVFGSPPSSAVQVELIRAADVPVKQMQWLWRPRFGYGAITLLEGGPEKGKSTLLVDLAARVSRGQSFPGESAIREPTNVVMLVAEDDTSTTVVPRLIAAGADLARIYFLGATKDDEGHVVPFHMTDDCDRLCAKCQHVCAGFVVVDPLVSYLGSRKGRAINTNNDLEVRKALAPLKELAERLGASVAAIRHYRKGTATDAMEAGGGSVGFAALVRVILAALPDPDDDSRYLLAVAKNNLVAKSERPAVRYQIVPSESDPTIGRISWGEKVDMSAGEILTAQADAGKVATGKVAEAMAFLEEHLASGEWRLSTEIMKDAEQMKGLSEQAVKRARWKVPIVVEKRGVRWYWRLESVAAGGGAKVRGEGVASSQEENQSNLLI